MLQDIIDLHTHTEASGHASGTMDDVVQAAVQKGAKIIGISDHAPAMAGSEFERFFQAGLSAPRKCGAAKILFGAELNILDYEGRVDLDEEELELLDYAIASLHVECIRPGTIQENTGALLNVMKHPKVLIIGHPDDGAFEVDFDQLAVRAAQKHVLIELNEASVMPHSYRKNARNNAVKMLSACRRHEAQIIVSSDAHAPKNVMGHTYALQMLEELHFPDELVVNSSAVRLEEIMSLRKSK